MNRSHFLLCFLWVLALPAAAQSLSARKAAAGSSARTRVSELETRLIAQGLVNVKKYIPDAILDIRYASTNNFLGVNVYGAYNKCYLQPDVARKLQKADSLLKGRYPGWKLVLYDCARPVSVQQKMWDALDMPPAEKGKYVSNPKHLSVHNLGAAVDLGLAEASGRYADMGTEFDFFGDLAYPYLETQWLKMGKLTQNQVKNRQILRDAMRGAGFSGIPHEWWHFNSGSREVVRNRYRRID